MKKIIIVAAVILTSGLTALSLSKKDTQLNQAQIKTEKSEFASKAAIVSSDKADVAIAD